MCAPSPWASASWTACDSNLDAVCEKIYRKITTLAKDLVATGDSISNASFGIPIVNKRISVTPIALVGGSLLQDAGGFCDHCKDAGPGGEGGGRQLHRRLFGPGVSKGMTSGGQDC